MKISALFFLFFGSIILCEAQDSTLMLTSKMFDAAQEIFMTPQNGWIFKEGNNVNFSKKDIDFSDWKPLNPTLLTAKNADKKGKVEGWFRIKIKLDDSFGKMPLGFRIGTWAAVDLFVDGNFVHSFGNTGTNGKAYEEYRYHDEFPVSVNLETGKEHLVALHFVDFVSPFPPRQLKSESTNPPQPLHSEYGSPDYLIRLTGPKHLETLTHEIKIRYIFDTIWLAICAFLSLLFWLLAFLNPREKNLKLFAMFAAFSTLSIIGTIMQFSFSNSYFEDKLIFAFRAICRALIVVMILNITSQVFKNEITRNLKILSIVIPCIAFFTSFYKNTFIDTVTFAVFLVICIYFLVSSWKTLKNIQWSVVVGLLLTLFWILFWVIDDIGLIFVSFPIHILLASGIYLTFPLSLLVYAALRFKEILIEVQDKARKILQVNEEKKEILAQQNEVLELQVIERTAQLNFSLENLKSTQNQLIQKEKLASLGELMAGIAHEIQNPLNFVNNFSELGVDLSNELKQELEKVQISDEEKLYFDEILMDLTQNQQKINHHGKRASSIISGMLQHSRVGAGTKELTDISKLADESLQLSYQAHQAKDNHGSPLRFNVKIETNFDESLPKIEVVSQDLGRAFLNLINNAFYAVTKKQQNVEVGKVIIGTKKISNFIEIMIKDNGIGMSEITKNKIFQPFFTTKPPGEGTGLGLSLAYDIITKGHGGTIEVESIEGEGTLFLVRLPNQKFHF